MQPGLPGRSYRISDYIFGDGEFVCKRHASPTFERHILKSEYVLPRQASRTINLNTHVLVLMKNLRDLSQIPCLAWQTFMGKSKFLLEAFRDTTSEPYGYLILDSSPTGNEAYRVRTRVFTEEDIIIHQPV